jgi:hypothetical protein
MTTISLIVLKTKDIEKLKDFDSDGRSIELYQK